MRRRRRSLFVRALLAGLLATGVLAVWSSARPWRQQWIAWRLTAALHTAPESELPQRMAELTLLEAPGLAALVDALAGNREELSRAAEETISDELQNWKRLPRHEAERSVAALAEALAQRAGNFGRYGDSAARGFALELLQWPIDRNSPRLARLTIDCEAVLREPAAETGHGAMPVADQDAQRLGALDTLRPAVGPELPGGGLPIDAVHVPQLPPELEPIAPRPIVVPDDERSLLSPPPKRLEPPYAYPVPRPSRGVPIEIDEPPAAPDWPIRPPDEPAEPGATESRTLSASSPAAANDEDRLLGLMRLLHDADPYVRKTAEGELRRHGFTDAHVGLALRLTDPDVQRRVALAALLPQMAGLDARAWLQYLSRDEDERVRRAALSVMSATRDPQLLDQVRQATPR